MTLRRCVPEVTRERLVNPHRATYAERVRSAGATDLRENFRIEDLGAGYGRVVIVDPQKKVTR
jgi:hypothetical protein